MRLLDLFSGAGGCAMGYIQAGFEVVGVDIHPQPNYPGNFVQADALTFPLEGFDCYHASPPCQHYTTMLNHGMADRTKHPDLVDAIRQRLQATGKPYIIENVVSAPVENPITLCGAMFGLRVYRHRLFESNIYLYQPAHPRHKAKAAHAGTMPKPHEFYCPVGHFADLQGSMSAMGIDWMSTKYEVAQSVPPAYTRFLGEQLLAYLEREQEVSA